MSLAAVGDALKSMTRRQLEELADSIAKELRACVLCGGEGAKPFSVRRSGRPDPGEVEVGQVTMLFCLPCFEKQRLPASRASA